MLAQTAEDTAEALTQLSKAAFEYKLDGARIQLHKKGGEVRIFTRRLNDVTAALRHDRRDAGVADRAVAKARGRQ